MNNDWFYIFMLMAVAYWVGLYIGRAIESRSGGRKGCKCVLCDLEIDATGRRL